MEILLPAFIIAVIVIGALVVRNRELKGAHDRLYAIVMQSIPADPLTHAARTIALPDVPMIKQSNFDRAVGERDARIVGLRKELGAAVRREGEARSEIGRWMSIAQERAISLNRLVGIEAKLAASETEKQRLTGLYKEAESQRQRLVLENVRLKEADISPGESFAQIPMRIGTRDN